MRITVPLALILLPLALVCLAYVGWPRMAFRRRRDTLSLVLRSVLVTLVVLALAGLQVVRPVQKWAVVFLVDASDSLGAAARAQEEAYIQAALTSKPADDEWAVVLFGENVSIEKPFSAAPQFTAIRSTVKAGNTNLAEAIQTGLSLFPADAVRRMVILSDGRETMGSAAVKAQLAAASGVEISTVLIERPQVADIRILSVETPARVAEGQQYDVNVTIQSDEATTAQLLIFANGSLIQETTVTLRQGVNGYTLSQTADASGYLNYTARLNVAGDGIPQNNQFAAFSQVVGAPRVLVIARDASETASLVAALESEGMQVDVQTPANLPPASALVNYRSVIIANVPATDFSQAQMQQMQRAVRDLGGGLVFIGGPDSYGPGGYYQTPLEDTLPVETRIKDQKRIPQLTIVYLIDRSGSMSMADSSGIPFLELGKRAIDLSIDLLQPTDRAAVGTFDADGAWVAAFQNVDDKRLLQQLVATLRPGGGTDILAGMQLVQRDIVNEPSPRKHIILLTDGGSSPTGLIDLTKQLHEQYGVTTSVVALGINPPAFLREMTEVGEGNYHKVADISQIPNIFAQETVLATRSYIQEGDFALTRTANSPIWNGLEAVPALKGYVATTAKPTAQTLLRGPEPYRDPILVQWQYGLGRVVAFTGDASSRWGAEWVGWDNYPRFWTQVVNWTITETNQSPLEAQVTLLPDGQARVLVDARTTEGAFLNNLTLNAAVLAPDNTSLPLTLQQIAPGQYEGLFTPSGEGAYFVAVNGQMADASPIQQVTGWVLSYSAEYVQSASGAPLLAQIAQITGGENMSQTPENAFIHRGELRTAGAPIAPWLLALAAVLLVLDIAVRRLIITRSDLQRLRAFLFPAPVETTQERMSSLIDARNRARERTDGEPRLDPEEPRVPRIPSRPSRDALPTQEPPRMTPPLADQNTAPVPPKTADVPRPTPPQRPAAKPVEAPLRDVPPPSQDTPITPAQTGETTVGNLLKKRRSDTGRDRP